MSALQDARLRLVMFLVTGAMFMEVLDGNIIATALPDMSRSFGIDAVRLNVAISAYLLALGAFIPVSGWMTDRYGPRRVFACAIAGFTLTSLGCGLVENLHAFVVLRVLQGASGALMVPVGRLLVLRHTPQERRMAAMSNLVWPALVAPVIAPPLGGFMVTYMSWHWIFLINIPIGVLGIVLVLRYVAEIKEAAAPRLDWIGFLLSAVCLATLVSGFEAIGRDVMPLPLLLGLIAVGIACGLLYGRHARRTEHPIIDLALMRIPTFAISTLGGNLCRFAVGATPFLLAMLLQVGFGLSPFKSGLVTFTSALGAMGMKAATAGLLRRFGFRNILLVNTFISGAFLAVCALFTAATPPAIMPRRDGWRPG